MSELHEQLRDILARAETGESAEGGSVEGNIIPFEPNGAQPPKQVGTDVLSLVFQAAETIRSREDQAEKKQAKTLALAQRAIDELRIAKKRIQSAEEAQHAVEAHAIKIAAQVKKLENLLQQKESALTATEAKLMAAEKHIRTTEGRAQHAECALTSVEEAIRAKLLARDADTLDDVTAAA